MATQTQEQRVAAAGPQNIKTQQTSATMNAKVAAAAPQARPAPRK